MAEQDDKTRELHWAIVCGKYIKARLMIALGVDVTQADVLGCTPLHDAVEAGQRGLVQMILKRGANVNAMSPLWGRPAHLAADGGRIDLARLLMRHGASFGAPLHDAIARGEAKAVSEMIDEAPEIVDAEDAKGWRPLDVAVRLGESEICRLLLDRGADAFILERQQHTLLHVAARLGYTEIVELLLDHGLEIEVRTAVTCENAFFVALFGNETPLWLASRDGRAQTVRLLLDRGAEVNAKAAEDVTPLHVAMQNGHREVASALLEHGADENAVDSGGRRPADILKARSRSKGLRRFWKRIGSILPGKRSQAARKRRKLP